MKVQFPGPCVLPNRRYTAYFMENRITNARAKVNVLLGSTGIPRIRGGLESGYLETFKGLRDRASGCSLSLYRGGGPNNKGEFSLWSIPRTFRYARLIGRCIRRPNPYVVEQLSSVLPMLFLIRRLGIDVILYSEVSLGMMLYRLRPILGLRYRLIYSNVGPGGPPYIRTDHLHQIAPHYIDWALSSGTPLEFQTLIPYGIDPIDVNIESRHLEQPSIRKKLGLPLGRKIALSVGWISKFHKRTDYLIREFARLGSQAPYLVMLGRQDSKSRELVEMAVRMLGPENCLVASVPYSEVFDYYRAADMFVHTAFTEAFGRVFLEAAMFGLPCIVHDFPVMRYVLGPFARFEDLAEEGALAAAVRRQMGEAPNVAERIAAATRVRTEFSWEKLAPDYAEMFQKVARQAKKG